MTRLSILVLLIAVIAAFALSAGCTFNIPGSPNVTPGVTVRGTATPIATGTVIATATATHTVTPTITATATSTVTPVVTGTVTGTVTSTPTGTPSGPGAISGAKWDDLNGDHMRDAGEPVLAGWTIILTMQEQNGPNWIEVARVATDANGAYSFTGLVEGHYRVSEVAQAGWTRTYPTNAEGMHNLVISNGQPSWTGQDFGNTGGAVIGTVTVTPTVTTTATSTGTSTVTSTATVSPTPSASVTPTATVTGTATGTVTPATTTGTGGGTALTGLALTANNLAFDKTTLSAPAGSVVGLVFLNNDAGVQHNFALYTDSSASTPIFRGAIVTGQVTTTYTFTAPSTPGTYFFRCDVHPTTMTGTFVVT